MIVKIIGMIIGALVLGVGLFYFTKDKNDPESRKIYGIISACGGTVLIFSLILTILEIGKL